MNALTRPSLLAWRHVCMTLAVLAIVMKILVPPGFMAGAPTNDLPFQIYLCTAQGGVAVESGASLSRHGDQDQAPEKSAHDSPCAFAGHALGAPPPTVADAPLVAYIAHTPVVPAPDADLIPGRGLTGPPLPARGPPALLI